MGTLKDRVAALSQKIGSPRAQPTAKVKAITPPQPIAKPDMEQRLSLAELEIEKVNWKPTPPNRPFGVYNGDCSRLNSHMGMFRASRSGNWRMPSVDSVKS